MVTSATPGSIGRRYVLGAALLWSVSGVVTKGLTLDSGSIAFYRSLFAGLVLLAVVPPRKWAFRPVMVPLSLAFGAMIGLFIGAIKATTAANAIFLQCTSTFWVIPLGLAFLGERPDRRSLWGIGLAMLGVAAIVGFGDYGRPGEGKGVALGLASGLAYAAVMIGVRGLRDLDPIWLSAVNNLGGAAALSGWIIATGGRIAVPGVGEGLALVGFGVVQMAIPYALFARGLRDVGVAEASLIGLIEPVLNPLWVVLLHGERPSAATLVGGAFLLAGVAARYMPVRRRTDADAELAASLPGRAD